MESKPVIGRLNFQNCAGVSQQLSDNALHDLCGQEGREQNNEINKTLVPGYLTKIHGVKIR